MRVTIEENDAPFLAMILSYAGNADLSPTGEERDEKKGKRMLMKLAALCEALDNDAVTHIFNLYGDNYGPDARKAYDDVRRLFEPNYGTGEA